MTLQKASFQRLDEFMLPDGDPVPVQFNPTEFTLTKGAQIAEIPIPGMDQPILQFVRGQTETLSLELFFDTTDSGMGDGALAVTERTDLFYQLIKIDRKTHAPPVVRFEWSPYGFPGSQMTEQWSSQSRYSFQCVVESVRQRLTLFSPSGVPLRAVLTVSLREYKTLQQQIDDIRPESPDHSHRRVVQRGDTLSRIANEAYGDPTLWRSIADANQLEDPLDLRPGMTLDIPSLR